MNCVWSFSPAVPATLSTSKIFFPYNKPSFQIWPLLGLLLISDWLELSMANDEEKCYSANHNEPGASSSIPGGL